MSACAVARHVDFLSGQAGFRKLVIDGSKLATIRIDLSTMRLQFLLIITVVFRSVTLRFIFKEAEKMRILDFNLLNLACKLESALAAHDVKDRQGLENFSHFAFMHESSENLTCGEM